MDKEDKKQNKSNKKLITIIVVVVIVLFGLGIVGKIVYRKIGERIASGVFSGLTGGAVKVQNDGKKVTYSSDGKEFVAEAGGKLPDAFPKDFPVYLNAQVISSWTAKGEQNDGISVIWETTDSAEKVSAFYKEKLAAGGWTINSSFEEKLSTTFSFEKDKNAGFVGITEADGKTNISVTLGAN
jgi:hypothetical protein